MAGSDDLGDLLLNLAHVLVSARGLIKRLPTNLWIGL